MAGSWGWWIGGVLFPILTALAVQVIQRRRSTAETNERADSDPREHYSLRNSTAGYGRLHDAIDTQFSDDELQSLCNEMGIEYANLPARTKTNKVWELVAFCIRSDQIMTLLELLAMNRPSTDWHSLV